MHVKSRNGIMKSNNIKHNYRLLCFTEISAEDPSHAYRFIEVFGNTFFQKSRLSSH